MHRLFQPSAAPLQRTSFDPSRVPLVMIGGDPADPAVLDPAVTAFASESGATDLTAINELVGYVKAQGLWDHLRLYPMKAAQNAGSGSTVYGLGGLTAKHLTLYNSPTWGGNGITFDGVDQHGTVLNSGATQDPFDGIAVFSRFAFSTSSISDVNNAQNPRTLFLWADGGDAATASHASRVQGGKANVLYRNAAGTAYIIARGDTHIISTSEQTLVTITDSAANRCFTDKTEISYDRQNPATSGQAIGDDWHFQSEGGLIRFVDATVSAQAILAAELTTDQRETITDLINAL